MKKDMKRIAAAVMSLLMAGNLWGTSIPMMAYGDVIPGIIYAEDGDEYAVYTESDAVYTESNADKAELPEIGVQAGDVNQAALYAGNNIDISSLDNDMIQVDSSNLQDWNNKTLTGTCKSNEQYLYVSGVALDLTISDLTINRLGKTDGVYCGIELADGAVLNLTLKGKNTLTAAFRGAGIYVPEGCTLVITEESTGSLTVTGGDQYGGGAGIGAKASDINPNYQQEENETVKVGKIVIAGGTVTAKGGNYKWATSDFCGAAGIGGSFGESGAEIEITGGTVFATGGAGAAGIGGGSEGSAASITISGGTVTAEAKTAKKMTGEAVGKNVNGAAIGNGYCGYANAEDIPPCGTISITGGTVIAKGNIGYGDSYGGLRPESGGSVTISGGSVDVSGKIDANSVDIDQDHILRHYSLKLLIYGEMAASGNAVTGTVKIGEENERQYTDNQVLFTVQNGRASASIDVAAHLYGEQPITVTFNGNAYGDKTVNLDTESEVIWGIKPQLQLEELSGCSYTYNNGYLVISGTGSATVTMSDGADTADDQIQIAENADVTLTLRDVTMDSGDKNRSTLVVGAGAKLKIVLEGSNKMTANVQYGSVVDAAGADVTIQGTGSLNIKNSKSGGGYTRGEYNSGITADSLSIKETPVLSIDITQYGIGLRSDRIFIGGGKIRAKSGSYGTTGMGQGFLAGSASSFSTVTITGGTIYAEGGSYNTNGGGICNVYTQAVITGGNVNMNRLYKDGGGESFKQPKNTADTPLYCTVITVGEGRKCSKNTQVLGLTIKNGTSSYAYGINQMFTDEDGKIYLWLPAGSIVSEVKTINGTYTGSCTTNTDTTSKRTGNIWGTAAATFSLQGDMFYPVEDIELGEINRPGEFNLTNLTTIKPANATVTSVNWSIEDNGRSVAELNGSTLKVKNKGTFTLKAVIPGGKGNNQDFVRTFQISSEDAVTEPTASEISYGNPLSSAVLSDENWHWADDTVIPTVKNNGYPACISVAADMDYTGVEGYNAEDHTITRVIPVTVNKAVPTVTIQVPSKEMIVGKKERTVAVTAEAHNPNNEAVKDVPEIKLFYQIGSNAETEFTESGYFVVPEGTVAGTVITVTAKTDSGDNYENGTQVSTIQVIACPHTGSKMLMRNENEHWEFCEDCEEQINHAPHSGGNATCIAKAVCSVCSTEYGLYGDHRMTKVDASAATCTAAGNVEYWHCEICGRNFRDENGRTLIYNVVTTPLNHDWGEWTKLDETHHQRICKNDSDHKEIEEHVEETAPTCETQAVCSICHDVYGNILGHDWGEWTDTGDLLQHTRVCRRDENHTESAPHVPGDQATCTTPQVCLECGAVLDPVKGHSFGEWKTTISPTCTEKGQEQRNCLNCQLVETRDAAPSGHDWEDDYTIDKQPACTETGSRSIHCKNCEAIRDSEILPEMGHNYGAWMSDGNGMHTRICMNDSSHTETEMCSGGTATCTAEAICADCGGFYGGKDSSNHVGGTEVRDQREATTAADGYTGDTYCLGCGEKIMSGTVIPKKVVSGSSDSSEDHSTSSSGKNGIPKKPKSNADSTETGTWKKDARGWWYQYPDSSYAKGWRGTNAAGETYQQISWKFINGKWWCFDADGYLVTGWVWDVNGAAWYYIDENGGMKTGWFREREDTPWYYLDPKTGAMLKDTHVDGYYVDKTGKWDGK